MLLGDGLLSRDEPVDLRQDVLERRFYVCRIQRGSFDEGKVIFLSESFRFVRWNGAKMSQIGLIANQHDDDVLIWNGEWVFETI